jgi:biotin carboxyl carrier protein
MKLEVTLDGEARTIDVVVDGDGWIVTGDDGVPVRVRGQRWIGTGWRLALGDAPARTVDVAVEGESVFVLDGGVAHRGSVVDVRRKALDLAGGAAKGTVVSPMPGAVVRVPVQPGEAVAQGQVLVVVEAMKMENEFRAPIAGVVASVLVLPGQAVEAGAILVVLAET